VATGEVVAALRTELPALADGFRLRDPAFDVPATGGMTVAAWTLD
jgi:hypothetical protein